MPACRYTREKLTLMSWKACRIKDRRFSRILPSNFLCIECSKSRENLTLKSCKAWPWRQAQHFSLYSLWNKMPARGPYQKLSETDRARALACLDAGMGSREGTRRFRTSHQTINRIRQRYRQTGHFKDRHRSGRPKVTTRAEDRYVTNSVVRNRFMAGPEARSAARGRGALPVSVMTVRNRIRAGGFKSRLPAKNKTNKNNNKKKKKKKKKQNWFSATEILASILVVPISDGIMLNCDGWCFQTNQNFTSVELTTGNESGGDAENATMLMPL